MPLFRVSGHRHAFKPEEADETYEATIRVRISYKKRGGYTPAENDVMVVAERAVSDAANAYAFYTAQVEYVSLDSLREVTADA